jgi:type IV pilus assembly protein PilY1
MNNHSRTRKTTLAWRFAVTALASLTASLAVAQTISQAPLSAGGNVPGNMVLTPSVEWPTLDSVANLDATYVPATVYVGLFDSEKCYLYHANSLVEEDRYFYPSSLAAANHVCSGKWSGNFLNWATTQTIDPFRKALTGGQRRHTATYPEKPEETILVKAWADTQAGATIFPDQTLTNSTITQNATPIGTGWGNVKTRIRGLGIKFRFTYNQTASDLGVGTPTQYDPATATFTNVAANRLVVYEASVRVKVCDAAVGLEANCVKYGSYYKPEGLIQKYSNRVRYSVFGYLNDPNDGKSGAALRARQKFVGPERLNPSTNLQETNPNTEWNKDTGVMIQNPDPTDASNTTGTTPAITNSGVMNYLNKFGSMSGANHKQHDPVSEMYYSAIRYLRNKSYPAAYGTLSGTAATKYTQADGFPVITTWSGTGWDPMQYRCQNNSILGIGDVYTWYDKNVPGSTDSGSEGTMVTDDTDFNADTWLRRLSKLEFGTETTIGTPFHASAGRGNSAYIAALAYYAHVTDIRTETTMKGKQTVSTYWVDVRENKRLEARKGNQYWLATKYGGFTVPDNYNAASPPAWQTSWWNTSGDTLLSSKVGDITPDPVEGENAIYAQETMGRPDNFYVGNQADKMVESLTRAFAKIASERAGSGSALAANSTRLDTTTRIYQAQFRNGSWFGQINAYSIDPLTGQLSASPVWRAGTHSTLAPANWASRKIYMNKPGTGMVAFLGSNLTATQQAKMTFTGMGTATYSDVVDYIRGKQTKEESYSGGTLRTRTPPEASWSPLLGDIVNSQPVFVGAPNPAFYGSTTPDFTGKSAYAAFATAQASRTKALWVGANDGMMHAFNADTGAELFAFVPNASIMNGLGDFADPDYVHKYFVDGDVAVADVYLGGAWKTVLVGTMGRGGSAVFALDVTNPSSPSLLWEKALGDLTDSSLGRNIGQPVIAQVANGDWRVIMGNGLDSSDGAAKLLSIKLSDGTFDYIDTGVTGGNGLTAVLARDSNGDGFADIAFAGDLKGNLWKFTGLGAGGDKFRMFTAKDASNNVQPITAAPLAGRDPNTGIVWVFFGTGKFLGTSDLTSTSAQTWYGIKDIGSAVADRSDLVQRLATAGVTIDGSETRLISQGAASDVAGKKGWYIDLPVSKERMVVPNRFQGTSLIGTTRIPDSSDVCSPAGKGYVMAISPFTGARLAETFFDMNRDGVFNDSDRSSGSVVSGFALDGMPNSPIFVEDVMLTSLDGDGPGQANDGIDNDGDGQIDEDDEDDTDDTDERKTQGSSVQTSRMSWREVVGS